MNPYDKAHELARELKRSNEVLNMISAKEAIKADPAASRMMDDFDSKQQAVYALYQTGEPPLPGQLEELRSLMEIMRQNSVLANFLQADARVGQLISDIQRIIADAIAETRWEQE